MNRKIWVIIIAVIAICAVAYVIYAQANKEDFSRLLIQPDRPVSFGEQTGGGFIGNPNDLPPEVRKAIEEENKKSQKREDSWKRGEKIMGLSGVLDCSYNFSKKFFAQSDKKENFVISPISVYILLSLISQGAEGDTRKEIENLINIKKYDINKLYEYYNFLLESNEYEMADCVFVNRKYKFEKDFMSLAKDKYKCEVKNLSANPLKDLNNWAKSKTHGKIPEIVNEVNENMVMALLNAVYYKGSWLNEFEEHENGQWTDENGEKTEINYMVNGGSVGTVNGGYVYTLATKGNTRVLFILPPENMKLSDYIAKNKIDYYFQPKQEPFVEWTVWLPKFSINTDTDLKSVLMNMGMKTAFQRFDADFSKIIDFRGADDNLYISDATQKATIDVDEKGVEAAAVTYFGYEAAGCAPPPQMQHKTLKFDRPFAFMITDDTTTPLFMGAVYDPTK